MRRARGGSSPWALLASVLAAAAPLGARALEQRWDHRDQHGPLVEALLLHDTVAESGHATESFWRPGLRLAYGFDVTGEGGELSLGVQAAPPTSDPVRRGELVSLDARYRGYFGLDEWKTFFEAGVWATVATRFSIGPLLRIGLQYELSRNAGLFAALGFSTAFGEMRIASVGGSVGAQLRFE
ncbi:MAG TPA: hypothetical protein VLU43_12515 [Anaeromyxobacteraceae bacterium]|nr:hypothetical protein [Anaeromyxobacteraceae bacterium]